MVDVTVRDGYAAASIARVIAAAGVSRPTFYDHFTDKDDCFLAALADTHERLLGDIAQDVQDAPREEAVQATIKALIAFAASQPQRAQFLTSEPMAGGPRVLDARDDALNEIAQVIEGAHQELPREAPTPDVSPRLLLGTIHRLLARRLRQGEGDMAGVSEDLLEWIRSYERPTGEHRCRALQPMGPPAPWPVLPETLLREPPALPRGRRGSSTEVAENQRQRILFATATVAQEKGYAATTIADITERAGVDRRAFNALFADKREAFVAILAVGFQRTMAVTAGAFFTAATWPERVWEAGRAFTEFLQSNPGLAHVGLVEHYAIGSGAAQGMEDSFTAFTIFLQEGLPDAPQPTPTANPLALRAIATTIFETCYHTSRRDGSRNMSGLLPHMTFLCLAPIIGAEQANEFIDGRLKAGEEPPSAKRDG